MCRRPQWAIYTAVYLCHQYFAKRSFQKSDKYVSCWADVAARRRQTEVRFQLHEPQHTCSSGSSSSIVSVAGLQQYDFTTVTGRLSGLQAALCMQACTLAVVSFCAGVELFQADSLHLLCCAVLCHAVLCCAVLLQLVAVACLYLGCKVQESPKYLRDVIKFAETRKWAKWCDEHPTERRKWEDPVSVGSCNSFSSSCCEMHGR